MKKTLFLLTALLSIGVISSAQDWNGISVPANAGSGKVWQLQSNVSDDFNYKSTAGNRPSRFTSKWVDTYHNAWTGPGKTLWNKPQAWHDGSRLAIQAVRVPNTDKVYCGIITSKNYIKYPVYFEVRAKIMNQTLANGFWCLSDDDTQEIDAMEGYGGGAGQDWFAQRMHISHHVFVRNPFQDYQPTDAGSWHYSNGIYWRGAFHRYGCYWKDPWTLEYYIDGKKVRTVSGKNMIDPKNFTNGTGLNKAMKIIIDAENQTDWRPGPTDAELAKDNIFWVDWVRVYKPVNSGGSGGSSGATEYKYDLGTPTSPVFSGYKRVSHTTKAGSYGWTNTSGLGSRDRGSSSKRNNLNRDIVFSSSARTFRQNVSNGSWNVLITFGDKYYHDKMVVKAEGQTKLTNITNQPDQFFNRSFNVNVNDGTLDIQFSDGGGSNPHWSITRIWLRKNKSAIETISQDDSYTPVSVVLYPNPATDELHISLLQQLQPNARLIVYNSLGKMVLTEELYSENQVLPIKNLTSGIYILQVFNGESSTSERFIKK